VKERTNTCYLIRLKNGAWKGVFTPGLPYDKNTKGMPHKEAIIREVIVQNSNTHVGEYFYAFHSKGNKDYIYKLVSTGNRDFSKKTLIKTIQKIGYSVIDSEEELARRASAKLTSEELRAIKNSNRY
jgi:hypothetical protein